MRGNRTGLWAIVLLALTAFLFPVLADEEAVITLGVDPLPPDCAQNPGGLVTINWSIQHLTTPDHVTFYLYNPSHTFVYDQQTYPGGTGLNITRTWTVPAPLPQGFYWARVEYYSVGIGLEAWAETGFLICQVTSRICASKRQDTNCNGVLDPADAPLPGWTICLTTPSGQVICQQTNANGETCWTGLPLGDYTVVENVPAGWTPVLPATVPVTLTADSVRVDFLNFRHEDCARVCCIGELCELLLESECAAMQGVWHPELDSCGPPNPCAQPHVCCVGESCLLLLEEECAEMQGVWLPDQASCGPPNPCARPHVCCVGENCLLVLVEECDEMQGVWHPELDSCGPPNPCAQPHVCCVGQDCFLVLEEECAEMQGVWHGDLESCGPPNPCEPTPTLPDSWGGVKNLYR